MKDDTGALIFIAFFAVMFGMAIVLTFVTERVCIDMAKVASIGGCNKSGVCGITTTDGRHLTANIPSIGEGLCVNSEMRFK